MPFNLVSFLRTRTLERSVVLLLAIGFALLVTVVVATGALIERTRSYEAAVDHSHQVRALAQDVLTDSVNAETGERGYLLTEDRGYLGIAEQSIGRLTSEMDQLRALVVADGPHLVRAVDTLKIHVDSRIAELKRTVAYLDAGRSKEALTDVKSGRGREEMDRIRDLSADIDHAEASLLVQRSAAAREANTSTLGVNSSSAALIMVIGIVTLWLVWRYIGDLRASRAELDRVNRGLEQTVAERTEALVSANHEIAGARDRAQALLREVNHRIANSLALVSSFVRLQARALGDREARAALDETQGRIQAVAQIHKRLYTSADVGSVDLKDYLCALVEELQQSLAPTRRSVDIRVEAQSLRASTDQAVSLGVILAELITNAAKYAYPRGRKGEIRVSLTADGRASAGVLIVEDDGRGLPEGPPKGSGLGAQIIAAMAQTLKGQVEYDRSAAGGVRARLAFRL